MMTTLPPVIKGIPTLDPDGTVGITETQTPWNYSVASAYKLMELPGFSTSVSGPAVNGYYASFCARTVARDHAFYSSIMSQMVQ